jgi:ubiquinone biosynthesis protein COQ4
LVIAGPAITKARAAKTPHPPIDHEDKHRQSGKDNVQEDIVALLREPLADARKRMGIGDPVAYRRAHAEMRSAGVDPYDLLAAAA